MYANPLQMYESVSKTTLSGRDIEAAVLTKAALKLRECQKGWDQAGRKDRLQKALKFNQRMWSVFQGELGREDNPLPKPLRRDLLRLSAFIDKRILETMAHPSPEKLNAIIEINQNIAAGLRQQPTASDN
ncbi:MAG: flagellar biosynthesis regulator FlaF [Deltaproteobacteria bacterium]|nr:flagellar biosynthesis regulator FlaF [Deltaproteobacteria bacterium]